MPGPRRLALMNLYLHGIEPTIVLGDSIYEAAVIRPLRRDPDQPAFRHQGRQPGPGPRRLHRRHRNKQLNFVQHVLTILKPGGRAAVVLPDNCLFADQAGEVFKILTEDCDLHTVLRLPRGTFTPYSQGVKANVVFFTKGYPTENVWIYDARTNVPGITKKDRPLVPEHFAEFEKCYGADPNGRAKRKAVRLAGRRGYLGGDRWRSFSIADVKAGISSSTASSGSRTTPWRTPTSCPRPRNCRPTPSANWRARSRNSNAVLALLENGTGNGKTAAGARVKTNAQKNDGELPEGWAGHALADLCYLDPPKP